MSERSEGDGAAADAASTSNQVGDHVGLAMQIGGNVSGGLTINTGGSSSVRPSPGDALPIPAHSAVPRPELLDELIEALRSAGTSGTGPPTGVTGDSGFGKTTLAVAACRDARVPELFPDGVLWTTVGYDAAGPDLANKLNELSERLSGTRPSFTDPQQAGEHLGNLVADKRFLLVIDDVWRRSQLEPFPGRRCRTLVTTRFPELLAQGSTPVTAGPMQPGQAQAVLCAGWSTHHPDQVDPLLARTLAWPLMLALANRAVRKYVGGGRSLSDAARKVADRLSRGAEAVDRTAVTQRCDTASAMVELSLSLLSEQHRQRCFDLAIFPGDAFIPPETLRTYWGRVAGMTVDAVEDLLERLDELALVQWCWVGDAPVVQVHDVVGDYLRRRVGAELPEYHRAFLGSFERKPAGKPGSKAATVSPESDPYLRAQGHYHRRAADRSQPGVQVPVSSALARDFSQGRKASRGRRVRRTVLVGVPVAVVLSAGVAFASQQMDVGRDGPPAKQPPPVRQMPPAQIPGPPPAATSSPAPTPETSPVPEPPPPVPSAECDRADCDLPARSTAQAANGSLVTLGSGPGTVHRYVQSSAGTAPEADGDLGVTAMAESRPVVVPDRTGRLVGFVIDAAGKLLYNPNVEPGVPSQADDWAEIATGMSGTPAVSQDINGDLVVVSRDSGGTVWRVAQNEGSWDDKMPLEGALTDEDPKVHRDFLGFLRVFVLDKSHHMRTWAQDRSGDFRFREAPLGNALLHSPPAVIMSNNQLMLFALDGNRTLRQMPESQHLGPNQWPQEWASVPELSGTYTGLPIVVQDESGAVNIFVRHEDDPSRVSYARSGGTADDLGTPMQPMLSATLQGGALVVQGWDGESVVSKSPG